MIGRGRGRGRGSGRGEPAIAPSVVPRGADPHSDPCGAGCHHCAVGGLGGGAGRDARPLPDRSDGVAAVRPGGGGRSRGSPGDGAAVAHRLRRRGRCHPPGRGPGLRPAHRGLVRQRPCSGARWGRPGPAFSLLDRPDELGDLVTSAANRADPARAIPRARLLAGLYPDNLGAQLALATTALALGDHDEGFRAIARCAESLPANQRAELVQQLSALAATQPDLAAALEMLEGVPD